MSRKGGLVNIQIPRPSLASWICLGTSQGSLLGLFPATPRGKCYDHFSFTDEKTEAQRVNDLSGIKQPMSRLGFEPRFM